MVVVLIKRECERHPGCYTLSEKCQCCVSEEIRAEFDRRMDQTIDRLGELLSEIEIAP